MATFQFKPYDPNSVTKKKKSKPSKPSSGKPSKPREPAELGPLPTRDSLYKVDFDSGSQSGTLLCPPLDDLADFNGRLIDLTEVDDDDDFPDIYELLGESAPGDLDDRPPLDPLSARQGDSPANDCGKEAPTKDKDHAEPPSLPAAGDTSGGLSTATLKNGPASGQSGRDAETGRPATPRPSGGRSSCRSAGAGTGDRPSSSAPDSAMPRQRLDEVEVSSGMAKLRNRDAGHDVEDASDAGNEGRQNQETPISPGRAVQGPDQSSTLEKSRSEQQDESGSTFAKLPAAAVDGEPRDCPGAPSASVSPEVASLSRRMGRSLTSSPTQDAASFHRPGSHDHAAPVGLGLRKRSHPMEEVDAASDHKHYPATKRRSLEKARLTKSESHRRRETASTIPPPSSPAADIEDRLHAILGGQDDEFTLHQFAVAMIKICLSIIENEPPSTVPRVEPGLSSPDASRSQAEQGAELSDSDEDDDAAASDGTESDNDSYDGTRSRKISQRSGQRRRWSLLEESRLKSYMKEAKGEAWIASKLGRSVSAVRQHWDIMCKKK